MNEPYLVGCLITGGYIAVALACLLTALSSAPRRLWLLLSMGLLLLGLNKQLDFQTFAIEVGRAWAREQGWYEQRRIIQLWFIVLLATIALSVSSWTIVRVRRRGGHVILAALGGIVLTSFVTVRAASLHHVDVLVTRTIAGVRSGWWMEILGIALIGYAAAASLLEPQLRSGHRWGGD